MHRLVKYVDYPSVQMGFESMVQVEKNCYNAPEDAGATAGAAAATFTVFTNAFPVIKLVLLSFQRLQGVTGQPRHSKMIAFWSPTFVIRHFLEVRQAWQLAVAVK